MFSCASRAVIAGFLFLLVVLIYAEVHHIHGLLLRSLVRNCEEFCRLGVVYR